MRLLNIVLEIVLVVGLSWLFGLFAGEFIYWLPFFLTLALMWHHIVEHRLLRSLKPQNSAKFTITALENLSESIAHYQRSSRRDKIKNLRLLSKLNRNVNYLPDAIIIFDHDGKIEWCNQISQQILEFYWDKKAEKQILNVIFYEEFKQYWQQEKYNRPLVLLTYNQRYLEIHLNAYDTKSYLLVARDITGMIRLLHSRQTFLSNMNHELRTPLTVLQGYLEMLSNDDLTEFQRKIVQTMLEQSQRMTYLLQQLNQLAKIETSTNVDHHKFNASELILSIKKEMEILNHIGHQLEFDIAPEIYIQGDEHQLQSVITNLIHNAIKHSGDPNLIQVKWQSVEKGVQFSVQDHGIGIPPQHIDHLTERFYRVDESRSNQTGGSGLGLAIVKHALEQHRSHLEIQSQEGQGSYFSFVIPKHLVRRAVD